MDCFVPNESPGPMLINLRTKYVRMGPHCMILRLIASTGLIIRQKLHFGACMSDNACVDVLLVWLMSVTSTHPG